MTAFTRFYWDMLRSVMAGKANLGNIPIHDGLVSLC